MNTGKGGVREGKTRGKKDLISKGKKSVIKSSIIWAIERKDLTGGKGRKTVSVSSHRELKRVKKIHMLTK